MNGFLIIDKNAGMSSYDVIRRLKKLDNFKKIGYIGTLDRNATGILPVALNEGVKLIPFLEDGRKAYKGRFILGITTDTYDIEGEVQNKTEPEHFDRSVLVDMLSGFAGKIVQRVPIYSSKKVHRKPLYKLAKKGMHVEPHFKEVEIHNIELLNYEYPYVDVLVQCSKGTYIRSLANDFGNKLGCGAALFSLKRVQHGEFTEHMAINIDYFKVKEDLLNYLIPLEGILLSLKEFIVEVPLERFLRHGLPIPLLGNTRTWAHGEAVRLLNKKDRLIGIGVTDSTTRTIKVKRLIND